MLASLTRNIGSSWALALSLSLLAACSPGCQKERSGQHATSAPQEAEATQTEEDLSASPVQEAPPKTDSATDEYAQERQQLLNTLRDEGIEDEQVLQAMEEVPRHELVPDHQKPHAYENRPLPIGEGQTISQPYIVALMTSLADLEPNEKALEIGTGSGYQAAVLSKLAKELYTIEIVESLGKRAKKDLERLGLAKNVHFRIGDGYAGWPKAAPFDAIVVTAAPPQIPQPLKDQLAVGGRMVIPVGEHHQELRVLEKTEEGLVEREVIPVRFVPMTGKARD